MFKKIHSICWLLCFITSFLQAAPLPVHEAFQLNTQKHDLNAFMLSWTIKPGYFLYQNSIHIKPLNSTVFTLGQYQLPQATPKIDKQGKLQQIYKNQLQFLLPILGEHPGEGQIEVRYQGCSEEGFCYPPQKEILLAQMGPDRNLISIAKSHLDLPAQASPVPDEVESLLSRTSLVMIIMSFFGFGLLLAFTPCVLPMIPILSSIILNQQGSPSPKKAFFLSLSYVIGLSLTYALIGLSFAFIGNNLQLTFQSTFMHVFLAILFAGLALSMFDLFDFRPPSQWQEWFTAFSQKRRGGPYVSSLLMGMLSTLILSPCVTPPLLGTLAYVAHTGNVILGTTALFFLGLGSGTPLLLISLSTTHYLPKAGHWMYGVKSFFGLILLGFAIELLRNVLPPVLIMALWGGLLLSSGVFIGALSPSYSSIEKAKQSIGLIFFLGGLLIFIGASMGNTNPLQPLAHAQTINQHTPSSHTIQTPAALQQLLERHRGQPLILDFYADWCTDCRYIAATTLRDPAVKEALKQIPMITVDLTPNNAASHELLKTYDVLAPPSFLFINAQGQENKALRITGSVTSNELLQHIHTLTNT